MLAIPKTGLQVRDHRRGSQDYAERVEPYGPGCHGPAEEKGEQQSFSSSCGIVLTADLRC